MRRADELDQKRSTSAFWYRPPHVDFIFGGRGVRSARARICRAISIGSPVSTSSEASSQTSCNAERISHSMISTARSAPQQPCDAIPDRRRALVGSIGLTPCLNLRQDVNAYEKRRRPNG